MSSQERHGGPTPVSHTSRVQVTFWLLTKADYWKSLLLSGLYQELWGESSFLLYWQPSLLCPWLRAMLKLASFIKAKSAHSRMKPECADICLSVDTFIRQAFSRKEGREQAPETVRNISCKTLEKSPEATQSMVRASCL